MFHVNKTLYVIFRFPNQNVSRNSLDDSFSFVKSYESFVERWCDEKYEVVS